jgi:hypothetical protein
MNYNLYLKYELDLNLDINADSGSLRKTIFADIMHQKRTAVANAKDDEPERTRIGFVHMIHYHQALAMAYGLNMTQFRDITLSVRSKVLLELDYTLITQETIDEVGVVTNPNIIVLVNFGISAAYRNKGMGEQFLKGLVKQMKGFCGYIVILNSEPVQFADRTQQNIIYENQGVALTGLEKDREKAQFKLNAFFQRCGFRSFKNYENAFICNVDQVVPDRIMVKHAVN